MWLTIIGIIFSIIEAIPEIEAIIKDIIGMLQGHAFSRILAFERLLLEHRQVTDKNETKAAILAFHAECVAAK